MKAVTQALMKTLTCTGVREEPLRHRKTIQLQQQMDEDERNCRQGTLRRLTTPESETRKSVDKHMTQTRADEAFPQRPRRQRKVEERNRDTVQKIRGRPL